MRRRLTLIAGFILLAAVGAAAQDDVLVKAREAARSGHRTEALTILESHLARSPRDVDARLLYGLVLSREGRYDEARPVLQQVLAQAPTYTDARVALMNVEYWSGHSAEAKEQADRILASEPGNVTARTVRDRLEGAARHWWATTQYSVDLFDDGTDPWQEFAVYLTRRTPVGSLILRGNHATRFAQDDQLIEAEFYPSFRPGTYSYVGAGVSTEHDLYPRLTPGVRLVSVARPGIRGVRGARYLAFEEGTEIYVGTLSKYLGNWMLTGKVYYVPAEGDLDSTSYHGGFRYYFGGDGTSYVGVTYSHGFSREIRAAVDLTTLNSDTVRGEFDVLSGRRLRIFGTAATSRGERENRPVLWQTTLTAGVSVQF